MNDIVELDYKSKFKTPSPDGSGILLGQSRSFGTPQKIQRTAGDSFKKIEIGFAL